MTTFQLTPKSEFLEKEYVLVQAWKKAHDYIRRHNWYADVLELDLTNADLESRLRAVADVLSSDEELKPDSLRLILAPKGQQWEVKKNEWVPTKGPKSVEQRLRPLAHVSVRDQIIATAFMIVLADLVETRQGDPRLPSMKARERRIVSYGHRLFCDAEGDKLRFRWGNAIVYRQYFQDYQAFVSRPQDVVDEVFGDSKDWAIVFADLSQFYDRVRPNALTEKISDILGSNGDSTFNAKFKSFFNWTWHSSDEDEALQYAELANPKIDAFDNVALPQGLVASGFFSNVYLLDFDDAVCEGFDQWHDDDRWQLVDYCRYVDDMRVVIRLGKDLQGTKESDVADLVSAHLVRLLNKHAKGLILNPDKSSVVLGRDASAGSIRVSSTMRRINTNTSGVIDLFLGEETIDLIEGLFFARQEEPLIFEDKFQDTFFAAKPDVRDETVARFAANRFRRTYRSLRPLCEDDPTTTGESLVPALSREFLDNKAANFCRRLIERWVRDPSNMRLLRVALDVCPEPKALDVVLDLLNQYVAVGTKRKAPRRVAWYCAAELLKAGATETGLVADSDCLPAGIDLKQYQEKLAEFATQIAERRNTYPWYLEQQAHLYLACIGQVIDRKSQNPFLSNYLRLHHTLAGRASKLRREDVVPFVLLQSHLQGANEATKTFLTQFRESGTPTQRKLLLRIVQEDANLADTIRQQMSADEQEAWAHLYHAHGILWQGSFPETLQALPTVDTSFSFLSVAKSALNPFRQEYAALHFARAFLKRLRESTSLVFPSRIKIRARNWRALWSDRYPIANDSISVEFDNAPEKDVRFTIPEWIEKDDAWKYQLGQILRVILTGVADFTVSERRSDRDRTLVLYSPYSSCWLRRRYGLFNGRNAFGPHWLPISSWLGALLSRLLEWPGYARFDLDFELPDSFDVDSLSQLIESRLQDLEGWYGRASYTPILPVRTPKEFVRATETNGRHDPASLHVLRVGVVQTVIPRHNLFAGDPELNNLQTRRLHRRHLSAVLGGVHRMLQVRETHNEKGSGIELLVFPELAIHPADVRSHIVPFVYQHRCMVFAGMVFHTPFAGHGLINSGCWIIPVRNPRGGLQVEYVEQGKHNLTQEELNLGIVPFRPVQWILDLVDPTSLNRLWSMSGSICYDSTDLCLAADLRNLTDMFVVPALNQDVGTFDNMAAALHYHMFQHVIVANCGQFGGSTGQAPFSDRHSRTIFHAHGNEQVSISFFEVDMHTYRNGHPHLKTPPAGYSAR